MRFYTGWIGTCRMGVVLLLVVPLWGLPATVGWQGVDEAVGKGLPKTAIELLGPIQSRAIQSKNWGEAARAIGRRIQLEIGRAHV